MSSPDLQSEKPPASTNAEKYPRSADSSDVVAFDGPPERKLSRSLKNRHIAMISIGGVIGTGLFLSTATSLMNGGPVGLLLGYAVVGTICFSVMVSLGEMVAYLPIAGGHIKLAERFFDPALSFAMGWNYWFNWSIVLPAELSAASVLINFWIKPDRVNNAVWITICLLVTVVINMLGAGMSFNFHSSHYLNCMSLLENQVSMENANLSLHRLRSSPLRASLSSGSYWTLAVVRPMTVLVSDTGKIQGHSCSSMALEDPKDNS